MTKEHNNYSGFVIERENFSFTKTYKDFIEYSVFLNVKRFDNILFCGWVNEFYLVIEDYSRCLQFVFGNIREQERVYCLPVYKNETGYSCFHLKDINKFPKDFIKEFKKRGLVFNNLYRKFQYTTVQRLICCCHYNSQGLHVHHIDSDINNNNIKNLLPIKPNEHEEYHLQPDAKRLQDFEEHRKKLVESKRDYISVYTDNIKIYILLYYRYVLDYKIEIIADFKGIKPLSVATIHRILKSFRDFKLFYTAIKTKFKNVDSF